MTDDAETWRREASEQASRVAWSAEAHPNWWLDTIADAMRRAHARVRQGHDPEPEWDRLYHRTLTLTQLTERKEAP